MKGKGIKEYLLTIALTVIFLVKPPIFADIIAKVIGYVTAIVRTRQYAINRGHRNERSSCWTRTTPTNATTYDSVNQIVRVLGIRIKTPQTNTRQVKA